MVQVGVGDEDGIDILNEAIAWQAGLSVMTWMGTGIQEETRTIHVQEVGAGTDLAPAAENRQA